MLYVKLTAIKGKKKIIKGMLLQKSVYILLTVTKTTKQSNNNDIYLLCIFFIHIAYESYALHFYFFHKTRINSEILNQVKNILRIFIYYIFDYIIHLFNNV